MPSVATAIPHYLTSLTLSGGVNTAYTAPSGTAILVQHWALSTNNLTATAGGPFTAVVSVGPTASQKAWLPMTAIPARNGIQFNGNMTLEAASHAIMISASSASAFDFILYGVAVVG